MSRHPIFVITGNNERYRVLFAGVSALILSVGLARFAYTPLLPILREQAGLSHLAGGWLATINYAGYLSGALLAASIQNLGRKYLLYRVGLVLALLSTAMMGITDDPIVWGASRFIAGLSSTAGMLLGSGLVLNWLMRQGHRAELGLHFTGIGLGIMVSGVAVALMTTQQLRWNQQWFGLGMLGIIFFIPAWYWLPAPGTSSIHHRANLNTPFLPTTRWTWLLMAAYFCAGFGFVISATFIVAILVKLPVLAGKGSWVWVIVGLAATPSCFIWDQMAKRLGSLRALMLAYGLQTVSTVIPVVTADATFNIVGAVLFGATFVGIVSLTLTLIGRHFPANPGKAMAKMTLSYGVAQIIAPAMTGYIATLTHSYHGALIITSVIMLIGLVLLTALAREEQRQALNQ